MRGEWIQTFTGRQFYPLDPRPEDVCLDDIAHALALVARFNGHTRAFYSVAQHSVLVSRLVSDDVALWALLHDASEAYLCDVPRPVKHAAAMGAYRDAEARVQDTIFAHFGLTGPVPTAVKLADQIVLLTEKRDLMAQGPLWAAIDASPAPWTIRPFTPEQAERAFRLRFDVLTTRRLELSGQGVSG
jgi:hypothetical protein